MTRLLADLSEAVSIAVAAAAPLLTAIRTGPNRHVTGILWRDDTVVTSDQALPALDSFTVVLSTGALAPARPGPRNPALNLALLSLETPVRASALTPAPTPPVGTLALMLGADPDGTPTARLTMVHRLVRDPAGDAGTIVLDLPADRTAHGGPVLDADGRLLGMAGIGPHGDAIVVPAAVIGRFVDPLPAAHATPQPRARERVPPRGPATARRGWLGVALQPITVPEPLVNQTGQTSGRMVVSVTPGGPADQAGLRAGDVLLALNGHSTSGSHALRAFLGADRIGAKVSVRLLRDGVLRDAQLVVAAQPAE